MMKLSAVILGMVLLVAQEASAARHCKNEKYRTVAEQIARLKLEGEAELIDYEIFPGGSFAAGYEYEVEPAHTNGLYTRTDTWQIGLKLIPGRTVDMGGFDLNLGAGIKNQVEATFVRFIKDPCEAILANPYSPRRIPLKAKVALGPKFNVGDYFFFKGSLGFVASADVLQLLTSSLWGVSFSAGYMMEGFYKIHVVRLDESHIRLKVIAHRGKGVSGSIGLGYQNDFEVFQVDRLNDILEDWVNTKPIELTASASKNRVFMVDYVLDLTDPEVVKAYESLIRGVKEFKRADLIKPFKNEEDLESNVLMDITGLENLYRQDYQNGNVGRIKRNLRTTSNQTAFGMSLEVGNKILGYEWDKNNSTSMMGVRQDNDVLDRFLLRSWGTSRESRFLYSWSKTKSQNYMNALFSAEDADFKVLRPVNVVKYIGKKKNRFKYKEFKKLQLKMRKELPEDIYRGIPWEQWQQGEDDKFSNFGLRFELLLAPEAILETMPLNKKDIKVFYKDYLLSKGLKPREFFGYYQNGEERQSPEDQFNAALEDLATKLEFGLDKAKSSYDRIEVLNRLKSNKLFDETGFGFIMSLRPDKLKTWYHLDLDISSNEAIIDYSYGDSQLSALYKKLLTIKAALDDDALDILREAESLSMSTAQQ